ncbi:MAG: hypothetical protein ACFFAS_19215 [Promethearchaeota archaeon]
MIARFSNISVEPLTEHETPRIENMPPVIGCFISDKDGKTLLSFEIFEGALEMFLKKENYNGFKESFDLELIPMFISAFERFSEQLNFKDLSGLDLLGTGLKMYSFFCFEKFTVTFFLSPWISINKHSERVVAFFDRFFDSNRDLFENFYLKCTTEKIKQLNLVGNRWLNQLNSSLAFH